jgi:ubiquinol-cytochrome c reductase cytochrome c1 subunit
MKKLLSLLTILSLVVTNSFAAGNLVALPEQPWSFKNVTSSWEKDKIYRGYQVATQVCLSCHGFKYIKHRDLMKVGFTEAEVKKLSEDMEMSINDTFKSAMSDADAIEVYAKALPDLSVMNKARPGGADYTHALLTGYEDAPQGFNLPEGGYYNKYFPGHVISMPAPLVQDQIEYFDNTNASIQQMSKDVTYFMQWTAEPELITRQQLGVYVLLYVFILAILLYFTKRRIWSDVKKKDDDES